MLFMREGAHGSESNVPVTAGLTVLIADDHHLIRAGLKLCLQAIEHDVTVLEAETLESAIGICRAQPEIDLVLLDLGMPSTQGATALEAFARSCPAAKI